jgi:hypothetical protein
MKTKIILAVVAVALCAAALVGVSAAQFGGALYATNSVQTQGVPPCANSAGVVSPYCINATTGEPYCYQNGTYTSYCHNNTGIVGGYCGDGACYGYGYGYTAQNQNQNQYAYGYGTGMMGRGIGCFGCMGRSR